MDQGISPVVDYLHIKLADLLETRCVNNADSLGIRHGGKGKIHCVISVVHRGWCKDMVKYKNIHKAKV